MLLVALVCTSCGSAPPLRNTHATPDALAAAVLAAVEQRDQATLEGLALSEQEFRDHVWPQLPASRPERNLPFSYVWGDLRQKSEAGLDTAMAEHGGRDYELVGVEFDDETDYTDYRVHRDAAFRVRDKGGTVTTVRLCGSMIEMEGAWKVFSYVVD